MSRCKLTNMNLRNIRKSREYQCLLIDLVKANVVGKAAAEGLLGYTIPAGLLGNTTPATPVDDDDEGGETSGEGGGSDNTVTLLYFIPAHDATPAQWLTEEYDLTNGSTGEDITAFAQDAFNDEYLNSLEVAEENPSYVEGESAVAEKYIPLDPQPVTIEPGVLILAEPKDLSM